MQYPRACSHPLDFSWIYHTLISLVVFVFQFAINDIGYDLHVSVMMKIKSSARLYFIVIEYSQRSKVHLFKILIFCKREMVICCKPVSLAAIMLVCPYYPDTHFVSRSNFFLKTFATLRIVTLLMPDALAILSWVALSPFIVPDRNSAVAARDNG